MSPDLDPVGIRHVDGAYRVFAGNYGRVALVYEGFECWLVQQDAHIKMDEHREFKSAREALQYVVGRII